MTYDVAIVGGGPGGLQAALTLGRARRRAVVLDAGPRRNALATHMHNFVSRDGIPPPEFRRIAREQLAEYDSIELRDVGAESIAGSRGAFGVRVGSGTIAARRVLLCTGMIDELPAIDGFGELWGHSIYQCPYCHGWEVRGRRWGYLLLPSALAHFVPFALQTRAWTTDVTVFTGGLAIPDDARTQLAAGGLRVEIAPVARLAGRAHQLESVVLADGTDVPCDALFAHPAQRHVDLVRELGVALDDDGYVKVDPMKRETSIPGIYAAGDLTTRGQAAIYAAAGGMQAAAAINVDLAMSGGR